MVATGQIAAAHMASPRATGDAAALAVLHDMLRYVERELRLLDTPMPDAADLARQAAQRIKGKFGPTSKRRVVR